MLWFKNQLPLTCCITTGTFNHILVIPSITTGNNKERFPIHDLNLLVYHEVCTELNKPIPGKDYTALATHMGYTASELKTFQLEEDPSDALLSDWGTKSENDVNKLILFLKKMGRDDLVGLLEVEGNFYLFKSTFSYARIGSRIFRALIAVSKSPNNAIN